jgi:hypothetical protein
MCKYNKVFVGSEVLTAAVMKNYIFLNIKPCNPFNLFFTLTMEAKFYSETSPDFQRIALLYTPEDNFPQQDFCLLPASCWFLERLTHRLCRPR